MRIADIIQASFLNAAGALAMGTSPSALARARERIFVKTLAERLGAAYPGEDARVFSQYGRGNSAEFGSETLYYDISVCRVAPGETADRQAKRYLYVTAALWQVEIDFSLEWRGAIQAINRLNAGAAENKLLVTAPEGRGRDSFMKTLIPPFAAAKGGQHLALIPHPATWDESDRAPEVWRLAEGEWVEAV